MDERAVLLDIQKKFEEIDDLYSNLSEARKWIFYDMHAEYYSLAHCIRWGSQAIGEILEQD